MRYRSILWGLSSSLLLLLATPVQAARDQTYPERGSQVFLGLDDTSSPTQVQDGRASDLQNVTLENPGLKQRYGYSLIGDTLDAPAEDNCAVTGIYYTKFSFGTERIVATCGGRFSYLNGTSWTEVSGINVEFSTSQNDQVVWATALDNIIATDDSNTPVAYDGTSADVVNFASLTGSSQPTSAKTVAFFKNFLIFGNTVENGIRRATRFRWSNVGTIDTWSDEDYIDIGALGGQEINAMAELYDNLYVFLTDSIYRVTFVAGADTFNVSKVTDDIGCIAKNSVQSVTLKNSQNGLIFLDKDKRIYFFNGIAPVDISTYIETTMENLNSARLPYAVSTDTNTDYYLCATNGSFGVNNLCLDFQYIMGEWTKHTNIPANAMAHVIDSNNADRNYFGSYESFVYQLQDSDLTDDVASVSGVVVSVDHGANAWETSTISGPTVIYPFINLNLSSYVTGAMVGAPIEITGGAGDGSTSTVAYNTISAIVVTDAFSTTPNGSSIFEVGAIDSYYTSKWYDMGLAANDKDFRRVYFWAEADSSSTLDISFATDLSANVNTESISLSADADDAVWGSGIWGISTWGTQSDVFRKTSKAIGKGRFFRVMFDEDDPGETFNLYGWLPVFQVRDIDR